MNFDSIMLAAVSHELQADILPGRVERITQPSPLEVIIHVFAQGRKSALLISLDPMMARIHLTRESRVNPVTPPAFCMLMRKYIAGAWLEGIEHPFGLGERVLRLTFLQSDSVRYLLFVELMAKHSNLVLTTSDLTILGAVKTITTQISRFREIRPGIKYYAPPRMRSAKRDIFERDAGADLPDLTFLSTSGASDWLMATFSGLSPLMAREAVARAGGSTLTSETVWYGLNDLLNAIRLDEYAPVQFTIEDGLAPGAYPVPLASIPAARQVRWTSFNKAIDDASSTGAIADAFTRERAAILTALRRALKTCQRELIDTSEGLLNADRAEEYKQIGDLLLSQAKEIPPNIESISLEDYFASENSEPREIALNPRLNAVDNAKHYYSRHKKARDSYERLIERQDVLTQTAQAITDAISQAEEALEIGELTAISAGLGWEATRRMRQHAAAREPEEDTVRDSFAGHRIHRYHSVDGWEVLVGENATSNDYLTTKIAQSNDIWLHARAIPSAHAVIRSQNRPAAVSTAALRLAAEQVARRSDAKHAGLVPVDYTLKKHVRKPRGAAPGAVTYSHEKTIDVTPAE